MYVHQCRRHLGRDKPFKKNPVAFLWEIHKLRYYQSNVLTVRVCLFNSKLEEWPVGYLSLLLPTMLHCMGKIEGR